MSRELEGNEYESGTLRDNETCLCMASSRWHALNRRTTVVSCQDPSRPSPASVGPLYPIRLPRLPITYTVGLAHHFLACRYDIG